MRVRRTAPCTSRERIEVFFFGASRTATATSPRAKGESIDHITVSAQGVGGKVTRYRGGGSPEKKPGLTPDRFGVEQTSGKTSDRLALPALERQPDLCRSATAFAAWQVAYDDVVDVNLKVWGDQWKTSPRPPDGGR